jgi:hypothetical protein
LEWQIYRAATGISKQQTELSMIFACTLQVNLLAETLANI